MTNLDKVREFHKAFGLTVRDLPGNPHPDDVALRLELMREERAEVDEAIHIGLFRDIAKELADELYVVYGTAVTYGIDLDAVFEEVHQSNMSKLGEDGKPLRRPDGKILKGPKYRPAEVSRVLVRQIARHMPVMGEPEAAA